MEAVTWWQLSIEQRSTSDPRRAPPSSSMKYPGSADNDLHEEIEGANRLSSRVIRVAWSLLVVVVVVRAAIYEVSREARC